jgi:16S rRNA G966 N2-methylase RsmD/DNA-directed RNA polymerase subunit RPC12/RpoP
MNRDLFVDDSSLPDIVLAPRTDPIYNAHGYLTKVPIDAILPYLRAFTRPGELVVDMFAGSGMTAVASRIAGRSAVVSDISVLGKHIGDGYLAEVTSSELRIAAEGVVARARKYFGDLYDTERVEDHVRCESIRTIWSFVYRCVSCGQDIIYFDAMHAADWRTPSECPHCHEAFSKRSAEYVGDVPVRVVALGRNGKQVEQPVSELDLANIATARSDQRLSLVPSKRIEPDREMYHRSALGKWGLEETKDFFSPRNAIALYHLWNEVNRVASDSLRQKLRFAFTAILPRSSRRYQWSPQRPLNAATQTYYIAPVYYEWNVFELYERKVEAAIRSDEELLARRIALGLTSDTTQQYVVSSASELRHLKNESVDYVFTDPPFGSNLFYSDMSLFQEAWLGTTTDDDQEAVIHTNGQKAVNAAARYEHLLLSACEEAFRVLRPGRCLSMVFGNSSGRVWSMVQRILKNSGFESRPVHIGILDKGQRSVKGLVSGSESVITLDLIVTVRKPTGGAASRMQSPPATSIEGLVRDALAELDLRDRPTPSHIYLSILKRAFAAGVPVDSLHFADLLARLQESGVRVNPKSGLLEAIQAAV